LTDDDIVIPDLAVVCNLEIIKSTGIYGAPDLIVEILSMSTSRRDRGYKKRLYERCGIKEYWIVDVASRSIEVYMLIQGKYEVDNVYTLPSDSLFAELNEEEKADLILEFKTHLFDDLIIDLRQVFRDID
jgi:Uma2 family endonuclease